LSAESVTVILECAECGARWLPADEERCAHTSAAMIDEPAELIFYCPACAEREFSED
jgi:DNA-directed RNA polymerase subunit M/transcription elongation factor TFIIS